MALGPLPLVPGGIKLRLIYDWNTRPAISVMNLHYTGTVPTVADLTTLSTNIAAAWVTNLQGVFLTTVSRKYVELTDLSSRTGATFTNSVTAAGLKAATNQLPANVAACISWRINYRYRGGHPRTYHPGLIQADTANHYQLAGATVTALTNAYRAFFTAINAMTLGGAPLRLAMLSYYTNVNHVPVYKPNPELFDISDCIVHNRIDSMRTRLGKETS